jgi:hypothetical protein
MANYKELRNLFIQYLSDRGITVFPYTVLRQWYYEYQLSQSDKLGYGVSANVHRLILRELQKEGKVVRVRKNLWQIVKNPKIYETHNELLGNGPIEEDEFDKYLNQKLRGKNSGRRK